MLYDDNTTGLASYRLMLLDRASTRSLQADTIYVGEKDRRLSPLS